jgi:hypothetical protein
MLLISKYQRNIKFYTWPSYSVCVLYTIMKSSCACMYVCMCTWRSLRLAHATTSNILILRLCLFVCVLRLISGVDSLTAATVIPSSSIDNSASLLGDIVIDQKLAQFLVAQYSERSNTAAALNDIAPSFSVVSLKTAAAAELLVSHDRCIAGSLNQIEQVYLRSCIISAREPVLTHLRAGHAIAVGLFLGLCFFRQDIRDQVYSLKPSR